MKRTVAGLFGAFTMFAIQLQPAPAVACGVKLIAKTPTPRQAVARSSNPSDVLVVGTASGRLTRQLSAKGHNVEVASDPAVAKRPTYAAVLTDQQHASAARERFGNDKVVIVSNDLVADLRSVEGQVARRPTRTGDRDLVASQSDRKPIKAGPDTGDRRVAAKAEPTPTRATPVAAMPPQPDPVPVANRPTPTPPAPKPEPAPKPAPTPEAAPKVAAVQTGAATRTETKAEPPAAPERKVATIAPSTQELYFGLGSASVANAASIAKAAKWLNANPDVNAVIEGHADPSGTPEGNMALSQTRAEAVRDSLVKAGIDSGRIEVNAFGDTKLKYGAADSRNRRVVIAPKQ